MWIVGVVVVARWCEEEISERPQKTGQYNIAEPSREVGAMRGAVGEDAHGPID